MEVMFDITGITSEGATLRRPAIEQSSYSVTGTGEFVISDYNSSKPFSSFLPGIAGNDGVPMWVFYVNRGQCICSMGTRDKNHPIMEYLPANWAYQLVNSQGFRTFIKLTGIASSDYYEPFQSQNVGSQTSRSQRMIISSSQLSIEEVNHDLDLKITVDYFTVPRDYYAGLIRVLRIENLGSKDILLEGLDGLPLIVPYGVDNFFLKNMRRTIEAFVEVRNLDNRAPLFKARVQPDDRPDVTTITAGNFYLGFESNGPDMSLVTPIVDPGRIFGNRKDLGCPERFLAEPLESISRKQVIESQFPCAMGSFRASIPAAESYTYTSIIGHANSLEELNAMIPRVASGAYVKAKAAANRDLIETLTSSNLICSSEPILDQYVRQNFLDNLMRGGFPHTIRGRESCTTLHLYSRKHGDLERDYNDFNLALTPYSQGNGNYRDTNQNRRSDLLVNPDIREDNIEYFYNLVQLDGFNPLVLKATYMEVRDLDRVPVVLRTYLKPEHQQTVRSYLDTRFTVGALMMFLREQNIVIIGDPELFLGELLEICRKVPEVEHGEGFWIDHWTYNLDLLENYLAVYPDNFQELLFAGRRFTFYSNPYRVQPRSEKYVLRLGRPAQLNAVVFDADKAAAHSGQDHSPSLVHTNYGQGEVYRTSLFCKLLSVIVNKLASLDPCGVGVEMEAGKPGWYDALNGLPGLFGSSVSETLEIKRHIMFLANPLSEYELKEEKLAVFEELSQFMLKLHDLLGRDLSSLDFWDQAATAKELFREQTRLGVSGNEVTIETETIKEFFAAALKKLDAGIEKARDAESNTLFTYFRHEVSDYVALETRSPSGEKLSDVGADDLVRIRPLEFRQIPLPLFLEGPVHYLRCQPGTQAARDFAGNVKASALYDRELRMYKVNASLQDQPMEIGRARVFSPGWLENESIWLHMEYKYLLELLRNGLYEEFYETFQSVCVPFLRPEVYGRSILENCSFLASSAHPDPAIHGNGFVARLSGATAEFIHILHLMVQGPRPFRLSAGGELQLAFEPALPAWLFTKDSRTIWFHKDDAERELQLPAKTFSFMFLGKILVVYHNAEMRNTYGATGVTPAAWRIVETNGHRRTFEGPTLDGHMARQVRERNVTRIDVDLR